MSTYIVGDIQGCFLELKRLLKQVNFDKKTDTLYVAGDLVARGPDSLATLRFIKALGNSAKVVLGNHDLHLLAIHAGLRKNKKADQLSELLAAPDIKELIDWLAKQPLIQQLPKTNPHDNAYMTHAGLSPQWSISDALEQAAFVHKKIAGGKAKREKWLARMYGDQPNDWRKVTTKTERFRYSVNALTRMRYCFLDGSLEFACKAPVAQAPINIKPWFELCSQLGSTQVDSGQLGETQWIFGHWAALMGDCPYPNIYALDTGCVWGQHLTMLRWEDKQHFIEHKHYT